MADFLASLVVFAVLISMFLYAWNTVVTDQTRLGVESQKISEVDNTVVFLVNTPGYPEDWNSTNVEIPGFASAENFIEQEKLDEWREISYERQTQLLLTNNYYMNIRNDEGEIIEVEGERYSFGEEPENPETVVPTRRIILFNTSDKTKEAELEYVVWR